MSEIISAISAGISAEKLAALAANVERFDLVFRAQCEIVDSTIAAASLTECISDRFVHLGGGRQNGKTTWAIGKLMENPNAVMVVRDVALHRAIVARIPADLTTVTNRILSVPTLINRDADATLAELAKIECVHMVIFDDDSYEASRWYRGGINGLLEPLKTCRFVVIH